MAALTPPVAPPRDTRATIVEVAARLLQEHGPAAVTTRAVARAAGVQAPTIYRLFGDKDGLLDAVAEHVLATYVSAKSAIAASSTTHDGDPVADLRAGWDMHIDFGLANPALFTLLHDPLRATSPAVATGAEVLQSRVRRVAAAGRLKVGERRAVELISAAGTGVVLTLLTMPSNARGHRLADDMYDALSLVIFTHAPAAIDDDSVAAAVTFRTFVARLPALSDAERKLMAEWLDRSVDYTEAASTSTAPSA